jgi:hypothetical protein
MRMKLFIMFAILMVCVSCQRKELLEPGHRHGNRIPFMVKADIDMRVPEEVYFDSLYYSNVLKTARTATVVSYPLNLDVPIERHTLDSLSGEIWLLPGRYNLLIYTSDFNELDGVFYRNTDDPYKAEGYTNQVETTKDNATVKSYDITEPDPLYGRLMENVVIMEDVDTTITTTVDPLSYRYWYEVEVDGLDYITQAYLKIEGMYTSVYLANGTHNQNEYASQITNATIHKEENKIKGEFYSFGPHQSQEVKNSMMLTFVNGRTINVKLDDISPEIKRLTKGGEIIIKQKIVINVGDDGSGFQPTIKDWEEDEITIPL